MTPEEFKIKAQKIYDNYNGYAGEEGHYEMDVLMMECLESLGYSDGVNILWSMKDIWYA